MQDQPTTNVELATALFQLSARLATAPATDDDRALMRRAGDCLATGHFPPPPAHRIEYRGPVNQLQSKVLPGQIIEMEPDEYPTAAATQATGALGSDPAHRNISVGTDLTEKGLQIVVMEQEGDTTTIIYEGVHSAHHPLSSSHTNDGMRVDFKPAFDMPVTPSEAVAMLAKWGNPLCMTFDAGKAKRAAELLTPLLSSMPPNVAPVLAELRRATQKFPTWPTDPLHAVAVVGEEAGELTKAVLQAVYEPQKSTVADVREEAIQTAAMALRFLASMDRYTFDATEQHRQEAAHG